MSRSTHAPIDNIGGIPGGNQRVAYLYDPEAVSPTARNGLTDHRQRCGWREGAAFRERQPDRAGQYRLYGHAQVAADGMVASGLHRRPGRNILDRQQSPLLEGRFSAALLHLARPAALCRPAQRVCATDRYLERARRSGRNDQRVCRWPPRQCIGDRRPYRGVGRPERFSVLPGRRSHHGPAHPHHR